MSTEAHPRPVLISFFYFVRGTKGPRQPHPRLSSAVLSPELHSTLLAPRIPLQAMIWSRSPILYSAFCWIKTTLVSIGWGWEAGRREAVVIVVWLIVLEFFGFFQLACHSVFSSQLVNYSWKTSNSGNIMNSVGIFTAEE